MLQTDSVSDKKVTVDVAYNRVKKGQNIYNQVDNWKNKLMVNKGFKGKICSYVSKEVHHFQEWIYWNRGFLQQQYGFSLLYLQARSSITTELKFKV